MLDADLQPPALRRPAIRYFLEQDYPDRELVVVDDGEDRIEDLPTADDPSIRYLRLGDRATIGRKRQIACEAADISGILKGYLVDLPSFRFYKGGPPLHEGQLHAWIIAGTLGFTRHAWRSSGGYPDCSIGEEVALLRQVCERGAGWPRS